MTSEDTPLAPGLYLVATPIGNLGDITLRALDILRRADLIACEDTRQTQKLLNHFEISTPATSCHEHNERQRAVEFVEAIQNGKKIAVVSDAGMPGISDPGTVLAAAAIAAGLPVIPIPGANAALSALIASGLPTGEFAFLGFLPEKAGARRSRLEDLAAQPRTRAQTLIFYEAPHRIADTLADFEAVYGPAQHIVLARELTKLHEEFLRGPVAGLRKDLADRDRIRGEFVLLFEVGAPGLSHLETGEHLQTGDGPQRARESISTRVARLQSEAGLDEKEALKRLARELGQSKSELYRELQRERARRK
ncbi:MAG TPA: 16S rRNA (cytidine(1402)-2'-O)-methyltransferase [Terracidiphilus sp.]|jgi:16S rRNA (cytidine1402-2'-O)-methyltransferase|nr:16S rRNA (cytidine(1402)-2'-O)-methyltransferase [Terracidiphilus sp.]